MTTYWMIERVIGGVSVWLSDDVCWSWAPVTQLGRRYESRDAAERDAPAGAFVTEHADMEPVLRA